ncbi:phage portal protein [Devosia rhodophyticola]|uniref:Phage portal protein n=1 Tax=Devosia rhodophyticola TaxID=3026423 RepID=A0ABY7YXJ3_9HYPH|nr:phage portal protein [Devosia rhodophyticola]WDR05619.1 phage portal protein [Devosia rhodophyticola]
MPISKIIGGLFARNTKSEPMSPVSQADPLAGLLLGFAPTIAGPSVTPQNAMRAPAVASAIQLISETVGTLPTKVFKRTSGGKEADAKHGAYRLVHDEANDWTNAAQLRTQLTADALKYDQGGFALANRVNGGVVEFIRLDPANVAIKADDAGEPTYLVGKGSKQKTYGFRDILHIQAFDGVAPIKRARDAIGLSLALEEYAARLFRNDARPSTVLVLPERMPGGDNSTALQNMMASWTATHGGSANSGKPAIVPAGSQIVTLSNTATDAQFEQMRRFQTEEIARAFRVPPTMLFDLSRATWSNSEEMWQQFLTMTLRPWLDAWQWAYARVLLTPEERADHYIEFVTDDLLTVSHAARAESYAKYRAMGAVTANEVRAGLNLPALPGGDRLENPNITPGAANSDAPKPDQEAA